MRLRKSGEAAARLLSSCHAKLGNPAGKMALRSPFALGTGLPTVTSINRAIRG